MSEKEASVESNTEFISLMERVRKAQTEYAAYTQEQVDFIFSQAAMAAAKARISLAKMAVKETGMGILEDKVIKNLYASENIYHAYKDTKTCGVLSENPSFGTKTIAEPVGIIAAVIPTTNPTSTAIFKTLLSLKTRNGIIISPHPRAKKSTVEAARIVLEAAVRAGAPENIISWIEQPSLALTQQLMQQADLVLATGGPAMVKAAYSSGKPAIGVGSGNTPAIIDQSADIRLAVNSIILSKTFDNGMICASEQAVIVDADIASKVKAEFIARGAYFLTAEQADMLRAILLKNGALNAAVVGQSAVDIAALAGFEVPDKTKILIGETQRTDTAEPFAHEKLSPVLAFYMANDFHQALEIAETLIRDGGCGHTSSLYINETQCREKIMTYESRMKTGRILINTPASHGGIGDLFNFHIAPSLTLGCGSWGGNSVSENVGVKHLLNIKTVAARKENMLWFRSPEKVYIKRGCLSTALEEIKNPLEKKRVFIVTDQFLFKNHLMKPVLDCLSNMGIHHRIFCDVLPDPTLECAKAGAAAMRDFEPDCIIAFGGGSAMDAAKIMWVLYEHPELKFVDLSMRFADIRKRIYAFPSMGAKAYFIAIPTTAGTGSEVTPFAVITDEQTNTKYPLADYELMPDMAIIDPDLMMDAPKGLTAASGIDALTHALESFVSMLATDYTDALGLHAIGQIFDYLPRAYEHGAKDPVAREKIANAATMAGMAFANAFLGVCHSMAHKLGAAFHIPHGVANALMINEVIRFNACLAPTRMGTFSQYAYPQSLERYALIADHLHLGGETNEEKLDLLIDAIDRLKTDLGIRGTIREYGVCEEQFLEHLDEMAENAFDDQCTGANPRNPLIDEIKSMYLNAYYGKYETTQILLPSMEEAIYSKTHSLRI